MNYYELKSIYNQNKLDEALAAYPQMIEEYKDNEEEIRKLAFLAADFAHTEALALLFESGVSPSVTDKYAFTLLHHLAREEESRRCLKPVGAVAAALEFLLDHKVSYLRKDENENMICYHYAARNATAEFIETLAKRGAKLNIADKDGNTGIHIACEYAGNTLWDAELAKRKAERTKKNHEERMASAKERNLSDEETRDYIQTSLDDKQDAHSEYENQLALVENFFRTVKAFAEGGVDIDEKNAYGQTALDIAVKKGAKKIAAFLAGTLAGEDDAAIAAGGMTLHQAVERADIEAVKTIAATGADLNAVKDAPKHNFGGYTPLAIACAFIDYKTAETLLGCGSDPSFRDGDGRMAAAYFFLGETNAFSHAEEGIVREKDAAKTIRALTGAGFDINQTVDDDSDTLLILACAARGRWPKEDVLEELLRHNLDLNHANRFGITALMYACTRNFDGMETLQIALLEGGADVSPADQNGDTALHYAVRNDNKTGAKVLCDMLLEFGANADSVNNEGKTALDIAVEQDNEPLVKLLLGKI